MTKDVDENTIMGGRRILLADFTLMFTTRALFLGPAVFHAIKPEHVRQACSGGHARADGYREGLLRDAEER